MDAAYKEIVQDRVIPHYKAMNTSESDELVKYLSDWRNREKIMKDFARLTVYMNSLAVERIEQLEAYSGLDLISDMGKKPSR